MSSLIKRLMCAAGFHLMAVRMIFYPIGPFEKGGFYLDHYCERCEENEAL